jgi:hypothetical protein
MSVKLVYCLRRRADLSPQEFSSYWRTDHAQLVRRHADAMGVIRYVQSHSFAPEVDSELRAGRELVEAYDGVAEIYFESLEAMASANTKPGAETIRAELVADEDRFIDRGRSCMFVAEEHVVIAT